MCCPEEESSAVLGHIITNRPELEPLVEQWTSIPIRRAYIGLGLGTAKLGLSG